MDIRDIDLVIVYVVSDSMNQLYQVLNFFFFFLFTRGRGEDFFFSFIKLCGRAGRGGSQARAKQKNVNVEVKEFCESKENCRRQHMLKCVESERVESANNSLCCDMCSRVDHIPARLKFESLAAPIFAPDKVQP